MKFQCPEARSTVHFVTHTHGYMNNDEYCGIVNGWYREKQFFSWLIFLRSTIDTKKKKKTRLNLRESNEYEFKGYLIFIKKKPHIWFCCFWFKTLCKYQANYDESVPFASLYFHINGWRKIVEWVVRLHISSENGKRAGRMNSDVNPKQVWFFAWIFLFIFHLYGMKRRKYRDE